MKIKVDLLERKATKFVLWRPGKTATPPKLIIGTFVPGTPPTLAGVQEIELKPAAGFPDLYEVDAARCGLAEGVVYHYWFEVDDADPTKIPPARIRCTDPTATTVDWDLLAPRLPAPYTEDDRHAASVIKFSRGKLVPCDDGGEVGHVGDHPRPDTLPPNNRLVIYEMPTAWSRSHDNGGVEVGVGTFQDVLGLVLHEAPGANFADLDVVQVGRSYLTELGVTALELLPPADSFVKRTWGYDTANFFAPDFDLGKPDGASWSTANKDLAALVQGCHKHQVRFFIDVVMAFSRHYAYEPVDSPEFFILDPTADPSDPDDYTSRGGGGLRNGFGSTLFRYARFVDNAYDPISGALATVVPARQIMKVYITRWMRDFKIDGIRMDSIENVANWDFVQEYKDQARALWNDRWSALGLGAGSDARFLVVGEELSVPLALLTQGRLDGLWNEKFKQYIRSAILGQNAGDEASFEWTVRKAIDCRNFGFTDLAQAVLYLTSHDVEGFRNERIYNFLLNNGIWDTEKRIKLAFCCLLTAVGVPQILAGDEFADQHDRLDASGNVTESGGKEVDPVNYSRLSDDWRHRIFEYVSVLVQFRTSSPALAVNDTDFIHVDFNDGKRVLVWQRGAPGQDPVVVLANFSDFITANPQDPSSEYVVPNWPATPAGRGWKEVTQNRSVPPNSVGREPIYSWEAKVYTLA
jgi:glycosidase